MKHFLTTLLLLPAIIPASAESTLEIQCSGLRKGDNAVYRVYDSSDKLRYTISLHGEGSAVTVKRRIKGLPAGTYKVTDMNWDWSYDNATPSITLGVEDDGTAVFQFQATVRSDAVTHFEDTNVNKFK